MGVGFSMKASIRWLRAGVAAIALAAPVTVALAQDITGQIEYGYWGNAARAEVTEAVSRLFEAARPGTTVQGISAEYLAYIERLTVQSAAGELPCVTQAQSTFLATYAGREALTPLDDLIASGAIDVSGIPPAILETGKVEGKQYMIPTGTFLRLVAYNATMAADFGIEPPPDPMSFEQYETWLRDAQAKLPAGVYAAENEAINLFTLYSWAVGHGERMFDGQTFALSPEALAGWFRFWNTLTADGVATPPDRLDELVGSLELTPLANGVALSATRDIPHIVIMEDVRAAQGVPSEMAFVSNPVEGGMASANVPGTNGLTIAANCDNIPLAAAYIDFFSNDPAAAIAFRSSNGVVVSAAGREALKNDANTPPNVNRALRTLDQVAGAGNIAIASYPSGYQSLNALLRRQYEEVAFNGVTPEAAAAAFIAEAATLLR